MITYVAALMTKDHYDIACNAMGEAEVRKVQETLVTKAQANGKNNVGILKHESELMFVYSLGRKAQVYISVVTKPVSLAEVLGIHAGLVTTIKGMK